MTDQEPDEGTTSDTISITVVRTGGFAGLTREWRASSADAPDVDWGALVDACPWEDAAKPVDSRSRDRFVWRLEASGGSRRCTATLGDSDLVGPWMALVDRVRSLPHG